MKDSSATRTDPFDGLEWRHVVAMLSVLRDCDYTKTEHIRKQYVQQASHFRETLAFMVCLRAVREQEGYVRPSNMLRAGSEANGRDWLSQRLFATRNRYRTRILHYLRRFHVVDGELLYRPSSTSSHQQSHVRNFLMEMGVVCLDTGGDCYRITPQHLDLYVVAQDTLSKRAPATVTAAHRTREVLGTAAEEAIVSYERERVGSVFADRVEHVALLNAAAGYDVRSVTVNGDGIATPRYIEVKGVSGSSLQFHWTRNEVLTAKLLSQWYYLYLLPVKAGGRFAMNQLEVIKDPYVAVLNGSDTWAVEHDVLRCCLLKKRTYDLGVSADEE